MKISTQNHLNRNNCWFCRKIFPNESVVPIDSIELKVKTLLGIELNSEYDHTSSVCHSCVILLNQMYEQRNKMRTSFYNTKAKKYYIEGDNQMAKKCLNQTTNESSSSNETTPTKNFINSGSAGIKISDVRSQVDGDFNNIPYDDEDNDTSLVTSSSQNINLNGIVNSDKFIAETSSIILKPLSSNYTKRVEEDKCRPVEILSCPECPKKYKTNRYLNKHILRHKRKRASSVRSKRTAYNCHVCNLMFEGRTELRNHTQSHKSFFNCNVCDKLFEVKNEYEWHLAVCDGITRAKADENNSIVNSNIYRRRTRSQTRITKAFDTISLYSELSVATSVPDSTYSQRQHIVNRYVHEQREIPQLPVLSSEEEDDDRDDAVSMITNFTSISQKPYKPINGILANSCNPAQYFSVHKYTDVIVPLIYAKEFNCHDCYSKYETLPEMMIHEVRVHKIQPLYYCSHCYMHFTRKNYLEMHELAHQVVFKCHQCSLKFLTRKELTNHLNLHFECSYDCIKCSRSFLTIDELKSHSFYDKHKNDFKNLKIKQKIRKKKFEHNRNKNGTRKYRKVKYKSFVLIQPKKAVPFTKRQNQVKLPFAWRLYNGFYEVEHPFVETEVQYCSSTTHESSNTVYDSHVAHLENKKMELADVNLCQEEGYLCVSNKNTPGDVFCPWSNLNDFDRDACYDFNLFSTDSLLGFCDKDIKVCKNDNTKIDRKKLPELKPFPSYSELILENNSP